MFPGAGASVYRNEEGEPMGWDAPDAHLDMAYEDRFIADDMEGFFDYDPYGEGLDDDGEYEEDE